jgi:hypothetical protein
MVEELLLCQCGDPSHQLIMFYDDDPKNPAVYVSVHLVPEHNFFKRLWNGLKYIFSNKRSIYGDFDEIILRPTDADKVQKAADLLFSFNKNKEIVVPIIFNSEALPS